MCQPGGPIRSEHVLERAALLQRRSDAARPRGAGRRRRSGGRGSHPSTVRGLDALLLNTIAARLAVGLRRRLRVRDLVGATGERQRARRSEGLGLRSIRRMSLDGIHLGQMRIKRLSEKGFLSFVLVYFFFFFLLARTDLIETRVG